MRRNEVQQIRDTNIVVFNSEAEAALALIRQANDKNAAVINTLCINVTQFNLSEIGSLYKNLRVIKMTGARFGNEGAEQVAKLISAGGVACISLEWCHIKEKGASAIAEALSKNDSICDINLWDNKIGAASHLFNQLVVSKKNIMRALYNGCDGVQEMIEQRKVRVEGLVELFSQRSKTAISITHFDDMKSFQNAMTFQIACSNYSYDLEKEREFQQQMEELAQSFISK